MQQPLSITARVLVLIGALNWGLIGIGKLTSNSDWNAVHAILQQSVTTEALAYSIVGLAAVYLIAEFTSKA